MTVTRPLSRPELLAALAAIGDHHPEHQAVTDQARAVITNPWWPGAVLAAIRQARGDGEQLGLAL